MLEADNKHGAKRLPSITGLRLAMILALILILSGCGTGGTADNSGQENTSAGDGSSGETKTVSQSTSEDGPKTDKTEQASGGDGELGTPALGDPGAPVVMVEYSDYQ